MLSLKPTDIYTWRRSGYDELLQNRRDPQIFSELILLDLGERRIISAFLECANLIKVLGTSWHCDLRKESINFFSPLFWTVLKHFSD